MKKNKKSGENFIFQRNNTQFHLIFIVKNEKIWYNDYVR